MKTARRTRYRIHDAASGRSTIIRRMGRDTVTTSRPDDIFKPHRVRPAVLENIDPTPLPDNRMAQQQRRNAAFWAARPNAMRVPLNEGDGDYDAYSATTQDLPSPIGLRGGL
jgi:hypothetical protein